MKLSDKLIHVRRATRLLAAYNRRLLAILTQVNTELSANSKLRLKHLRWDPMHHKAIGKQTTAPFGRWGWDYLPLSTMWMRWTTDGATKPVKDWSAYVAVQHIIDTGYKRADGEPDPVDFDPAEESRTELWVWVAAVKGPSRDAWDSIVSAIEAGFELTDEEWDQRWHAVDTAALDDTPPGTTIRYLGWQVDVGELPTEQEVEERILAPLRTHLAAALA